MKNIDNLILYTKEVLLMKVNTYPDNIWQYYHQVRKAKGYSITEIAKFNAYLTTSQLSRFERGMNMLSADRFLAAVSGLNMSMSEFFTLYDNLPSYSSLQKGKTSHAVRLRDYAVLKNILAEKDATRDDRLYRLLIKFAIQENFREILITCDEQAFLLNYFEGILHWTLYDTIMFHQCLFLLERYVVYELIWELLVSDSLPRLLMQNETVVKKILIDISVIGVVNQNTSWQAAIQKKIDQLVIDWDISEKITLSVSRKMSHYQVEKTSEALSEVKVDIEELTKFGEIDLATRLKKILDELDSMS